MKWDLRIDASTVAIFALGLFSSDVLFAQFPNTPPPPPSPPSSSSSHGSSSSSIKLGLGRAWYKIQERMGTENRDWERQQKSGSGHGAPRGFAPPPEALIPTWEGTWIRQSCTDAGGATGIGCKSIPTSGKLVLRLSAPSSDTEGAIYFGELKAVLTSQKSADGLPHVTGWGRIENSDVTITNWDGKEGSGIYAGNFTLTFHPDDPDIGTVITRATMQNMKKVR